MPCPAYILKKAEAEGVSLSELGRRGALKRASNLAKAKASALFSAQELPLPKPPHWEQLSLTSQIKPH